MIALDQPANVFSINNAQAGYPCRTVAPVLTAAEALSFVQDGFIVRTGLFDPATLSGFRAALDEVAAREASLVDPMYKGHRDSLYLRWLLTKDRRFFPFNRHPELIAIARAMLGPQIKIDDADARITFPDAEDGTGWHIHLRCVPDPLPPFLCQPHAIHSLLYLDDIGEKEGALCVLPGSHRDLLRCVPDDSREDLPGQALLHPNAGDVVLIHANLWHRAVESRRGGGKRRLLLGAFTPSWLRDDYAVGSRGDIDWRAEYRADCSWPDMAELLGDFTWA